MTTIRSMSKRRREAERLPPPPVSKPSVVTRSMSKNAAPKRKSRFMPFRDPSISYKGSSVIKAMLKRQHENVIKYLKRDTTGETETYLTNNVKVTRGEIAKFDTPEERHEALTKLGVIWCGRGPLRNRNFEVAREYSWSEKVEIVLKIVIKNGKLPQRDVICLLSLSRMIHNKFISCKSLWETLDLHGMEIVLFKLFHCEDI